MSQGNDLPLPIHTSCADLAGVRIVFQGFYAYSRKSTALARTRTLHLTFRRASSAGVYAPHLGCYPPPGFLNLGGDNSIPIRLGARRTMTAPLARTNRLTEVGQQSVAETRKRNSG